MREKRLITGLLLADIAQPLIIFRKGGVALIEFADHAGAGKGLLQWVLTPGQLRGLKPD